MKFSNQFFTFGFACAVFIVAACAPSPTVYTKASATPDEWPQVRAECMMAASKQVPPDNRYSVLPGQKFQNRNCNSKGCNSYSNISPPQIQTVDANEDVRKAVYQACLAKHGWIEKVQND